MKRSDIEFCPVEKTPQQAYLKNRSSGCSIEGSRSEGVARGISSDSIVLFAHQCDVLYDLAKCSERDRVVLKDYEL
jgi:hypothetical protein